MILKMIVHKEYKKKCASFFLGKLYKHRNGLHMFVEHYRKQNNISNMMTSVFSYYTEILVESMGISNIFLFP